MEPVFKPQGRGWAFDVVFVLLACLVAMTKYRTKATFGRKGFILAHGLRRTRPITLGKPGGSRLRSLVMLLLRYHKAQREAAVAHVSVDLKP